MAEVRWTPQAVGDLEAITDFIAQDSPHYASLFVLDVFGAVERLERFPESEESSRKRTNRVFGRSSSAITGSFTASAMMLPNS